MTSLATPSSPSPATAYSALMRTPFATLGIRTHAGRMTGLDFLPSSGPELAPRDAIAAEAVRQLERYLADPCFRFELPLAPEGTPFRRRVWQAISDIPPGRARTYGELARILHSAARAVGGACGANPIALVIPCHRVVGRDGALGGFMNAAAGDPLAIKRWLLRHEGYRLHG